MLNFLKAEVKATRHLQDKDYKSMSSRAQASSAPRDPLAYLPEELSSHCMYRASADGINENILVLLHGFGDTAGAPFQREFAYQGFLSRQRVLDAPFGLSVLAVPKSRSTHCG